MTTLLVMVIAAATLAFGAVYPWAYGPLFVIAAAIGVTGLWSKGLRRDLRMLTVALVVLWATAAVQLVPLPPWILSAISPVTPILSSSYNITTFGVPEARMPISLDPVRTRTAVFALGALGLYMVGVPRLLGSQRLRSVAGALGFIAVPLALFAIYTRQYQNGLIYGFWKPLDGGGADQAGPFINRNHFAGWMLMALCLMIGGLFGRVERAFAARGSRRRFSRVMTEDGGAVFLLCAAVLVGVLSLFWVISRSAIVSFGIAVASFAWLVFRRRPSGPRHRLAGLAILALILLAGVLWRGADVLGAWFVDERSLLSRVDAWRDGWDVVRDFPVYGTGLNTYSIAMLFYQTRNAGFHMAQAHNDYLQLVAEGGVTLTFCALVAAGLFVRAVWRNIRAAHSEVRGYWLRAGAAVGMLAIGIQELAEFSLQVPANAFLFCTLGAITLAPAHRSPAAKGPTPRDTMTAPEEESGASLSTVAVNQPAPLRNMRQMGRLAQGNHRKDSRRLPRDQS